MALINLNKSQYNDQAKKQAKLFNELQKQNATRFQYPTEDNADQLKTLLPFTWNGISFPAIKIDSSISHDIVKHKFPNRDGALLENMGRNPLVFKVTAVFANTINPSKNEQWKRGELYPNIYKKMLQESLDKKTQQLTHPFLGFVQCQILSFEPVIDAKFRGGEIVDITFIENIAEDIFQYEESTILDRASQAATAIDTAFANLNPDPNDLGLPEYKTTLTEALQEVNGAINQTTRTIDDLNSTAAIDEVYGRCKDIVNSSKRLGDSAYSKVKQDATILKASMVILKKENPINTAVYQVLETTQPGTLSSYIIETQNSLNELIYLNPGLLKKAIVPINTLIRYYPK